MVDVRKSSPDSVVSQEHDNDNDTINHDHSGGLSLSSPSSSSHKTHSRIRSRMERRRRRSHQIRNGGNTSSSLTVTSRSATSSPSNMLTSSMKNETPSPSTRIRKVDGSVTPKTTNSYHNHNSNQKHYHNHESSPTKVSQVPSSLEVLSSKISNNASVHIQAHTQRKGQQQQQPQRHIVTSVSANDRDEELEIMTITDSDSGVGTYVDLHGGDRYNVEEEEPLYVDGYDDEEEGENNNTVTQLSAVSPMARMRHRASDDVSHDSNSTEKTNNASKTVNVNGRAPGDKSSSNRNSGSNSGSGSPGSLMKDCGDLKIASQMGIVPEMLRKMFSGDVSIGTGGCVGGITGNTGDEDVYESDEEEDESYYSDDDYFLSEDEETHASTISEGSEGSGYTVGTAPPSPAPDGGKTRQGPEPQPPQHPQDQHQHPFQSQPFHPTQREHHENNNNLQVDHHRQPQQHYNQRQQQQQQQQHPFYQRNDHDHDPPRHHNHRPHNDPTWIPPPPPIPTTHTRNGNRNGDNDEMDDVPPPPPPPLPDQTNLKTSSTGSTNVNVNHERERGSTKKSKGKMKEVDPYQDPKFVETFVQEIIHRGISLTWHQVQSSEYYEKPKSVLLSIELGKCASGCFDEPKLVWEVDHHNQNHNNNRNNHNGSNASISSTDLDGLSVTTDRHGVTKVDLFDVLSVEKAGIMNFHSYPFAIPSNSFFVGMPDGIAVLFEAPDQEERCRVVAGLSQLVARLTFNLVAGDIDVCWDLFACSDGLSNEEISPDTLTVEELDLWFISKAMNDVTHQLVDKFVFREQGMDNDNDNDNIYKGVDVKEV